jgi:hypothetical protein
MIPAPAVTIKLCGKHAECRAGGLQFGSAAGLCWAASVAPAAICLFIAKQPRQTVRRSAPAPSLRLAPRPIPRQQAHMTAAEAKTLLPAFPDFVKTLQGDEKSKAQTFLGRLFKALGQGGARRRPGPPTSIAWPGSPALPSSHSSQAMTSPPRRRRREIRRSDLARPRPHRDEVTRRETGEALRPALLLLEPHRPEAPALRHPYYFGCR